MGIKDPGHFILRKEDYDDAFNWLKNHRHEFLCNVYERVKYAIDNKKKSVKLYEYTSNDVVLKRYNMETEKILKGNYIANVMLKYFEQAEHYDKCSHIVKWVKDK